MPLETMMQVNIILYSIIGGVITGIMFDLYRIVRGSNIPKLIIIVEDILFWILAAMIIFSFLLYTNYAFLGPYVYIFMMLSLIVYLKTISPTFVKIERKIVNSIITIIRVLFKSTTYPFKIVFFYVKDKGN